jgi:ethanolamine utilization protein EutA
MRDSIISVGIDLGTSTTQLVFSRITIENLASDFNVPKIHIVDKEIIYRSGVYFTPLLSSTEINAEEVRSLIALEYLKAGINQADVATGAIIITGETARKHNASQVLNMLSDFSGEFVVAAAGPDLESVLSGRGAGADKLSKANGIVVANLDIGGGTTNMSVFRNGQLIHVSCLDIGGRLIRIENGRISYIYHKIKDLALSKNIVLNVGEEADKNKLKEICRIMTQSLAQLLYMETAEPELSRLFTNGAINYPESLKIDAVTFSGGVAGLLYGAKTEDCYQYGDIGVLLAEAIKESAWFQKIKIHQPDEIIQATVVGAGIHTTELSGSTISYDPELLPIKNIPVIRIEDSLVYTGAVEKGYKNINADGMIAVSLSGCLIKNFSDIQSTAEMLLAEMQFLRESRHPLIIVMEEDFSKVIGNAIKVRCKKAGEPCSMICIDGIAARTGDYIDIGVPVKTGRVLPVVVKTLIFNV